MPKCAAVMDTGHAEAFPGPACRGVLALITHVYCTDNYTTWFTLARRPHPASKRPHLHPFPLSGISADDVRGGWCAASSNPVRELHHHRRIPAGRREGGLFSIGASPFLGWSTAH